jgi:hypothetical protein
MVIIINKSSISMKIPDFNPEITKMSLTGMSKINKGREGDRING